MTFTVKQLRDRLLGANVNDDDVIRVVFHGYDQPSLNLAATDMRSGPNNDFLIITECPRST